VRFPRLRKNPVAHARGSVLGKNPATQLLGGEVAQALGAEFVLLDLERQMAFFLTSNATSSDEV